MDWNKDTTKEAVQASQAMGEKGRDRLLTPACPGVSGAVVRL